jgi:hypothetical protein
MEFWAELFYLLQHNFELGGLPANSEFVGSMARVRDEDVPAELVNRIPGPLDPWYYEAKEGRGYWAKRYNVYGYDFFFCFSEDSNSAEAKVGSWSFVFLMVGLQGGSWWFRSGYNDSDLSRVFKFVDSFCPDVSTEEIVRGLDLWW